MATVRQFILPLLEDPRKQIRLLNCTATDSSSPTFDVSVWNLSQLPEYLAISYTWGSPLDLTSIRINGEPFQVRQNCYYVLWQIQLHFPDAFIWIDSICIDQESLEEKNHQVQMMGHIYANAKGVLACVGPHADGTEQLVRRGVMEEPADYKLKDRARMWKILRAFWQRPYWERLWIVQELKLAKQVTILCGEHILEFTDLSLTPWRSDWSDHLPGISGFVLGVIRGNNARDTLWFTLQENLNRKCANPRDHVYALLALYTPDPFTTRPPVKVDYSINLPSLALEMIRRREPVINDLSQFGTQFLDFLRVLGLCSEASSPMMEDFRKSLLHNANKSPNLDDHFLAACWDDLPITKQLPHVLQHFPRGCKAATFDADPAGRLMVRPFQQYSDQLPPAFRKPKSGAKTFKPNQEPVTTVAFDAYIEGSAYTLTARVTSVARPGDLLLRTGVHVYGNLEKTFGTGLRDLNSFEVGGAVTTELDHKDLEMHSPKDFVVVRWMGPSLWKVIGQAHVTACTLQGMAPPDSRDHLCFAREEKRPYQAMYSIMSAEAAFLQWTHCLTLLHRRHEGRQQLLDEIVSRPPPASYFYIPGFEKDLADCRKDLEPDWENKLCRRPALRESPIQHIWFTKMAETKNAWKMAANWRSRYPERDPETGAIYKG